jgi:hypothetical protein
MRIVVEIFFARQTVPKAVGAAVDWRKGQPIPKRLVPLLAEW